MDHQKRCNSYASYCNEVIRQYDNRSREICTLEDINIWHSKCRLYRGENKFKAALPKKYIKLIPESNKPTLEILTGICLQPVKSLHEIPKVLNPDRASRTRNSQNCVQEVSNQTSNVINENLNGGIKSNSNEATNNPQEERLNSMDYKGMSKIDDLDEYKQTKLSSCISAHSYVLPGPKYQYRPTVIEVQHYCIQQVLRKLIFFYSNELKPEVKLCKC